MTNEKRESSVIDQSEASIIYLEMCLDDHGEVSVVSLRNVLLVFTQFDRDDVTQMWTRVVPETVTVSMYWSWSNNEASLLLFTLNLP